MKPPSAAEYPLKDGVVAFLAQSGARLWRSLSAKIASRWFLGNAGIVLGVGLFVLTAFALASISVHVIDLNDKAEKAHTITTLCGTLVRNLGEINLISRSQVTLHSAALETTKNQAKKAVAADFKRLHKMAADTPEIAGAVRDAESNVHRRMALYDGLVAGTARTPGDETGRLHLTAHSNMLLGRIGQWSGANFIRYQKRATEQMRRSVFLAIVAGFGAPIFGLLGIHLLQSDRGKMQAREMQQELMHVQRLAIMGETSAMLAHEINQPLAAAGNYLVVLRRQIETGNTDKSAPVLERAEAQIRRAGTILNKLRRFIEKRECERDLEEPAVLVDDALTLLGTLDHAITIRTELAEDLPCVMVDRVQLQQVLVNLMRNAIEAMEGTERRELTLSVHRNSLDEIQISLADTGPGLSPEVAERLFQPFVSTKSGGMGVGLSICHSIIQQHHGRIWAEANPQGGTTFSFTLPVAAERAAA